MIKRLAVLLLLFPTLAYAQINNGVVISNPVTAPINIGTPSITDTGVLLQGTSSVAGYNQVVIQNTSNANNASSCYVVNNNLGTSSTYYGELCMNSSTYTGSGAYNGANYVLLDSTNGDLALGTLTANGIHFFVNNGATDAMDITSSNTVGVGTAVPVSSSVLTLNGHLGFYQASAPVVSSCGSGSLTAGSTDTKGSITGISAATACTITFATSLPAAPACIATTSAASTVPYVSSLSASAVTFTMLALTGTLYYHCL